MPGTWDVCWCQRWKILNTEVNLSSRSDGLGLRFGRSWWHRRKIKRQNNKECHFPERCMPHFMTHHSGTSIPNKLTWPVTQCNHPHPVSCRDKHNVWIGKLICVFSTIMIHRCLKFQRESFLAFKKSELSERVISSDIDIPLSYTLLLYCSVHTVHGVLKARILKWFAIPFFNGPHSVRPLHHDPSVLGGPTRHGS